MAAVPWEVRDYKMLPDEDDDFRCPSSVDGDAAAAAWSTKPKSQPADFDDDFS